MTADAQALQVALVMSAAICQRFDVMHQSGLGKSSLTLTPFTKRMAADVAYRQTAPISQMHFKCLFYSEHDIYYPIKLPYPLALIVKFYIVLFYADSTCLALWQFAPI